MSSAFYITYSGSKVYPDHLHALDIKLSDISHHLTKIERFGGALGFNQYYSVAQHCVLMTEFALQYYDVDVAKACLMHDASEAYLGDIVSPLKVKLKDYRLLESEIHTKIFEKYQIRTDLKIMKLVKMLDRRILLDEVAALLPQNLDLFKEMHPGVMPLNIEIQQHSHEEVEEMFLSLADNLCITHGESL